MKTMLRSLLFIAHLAAMLAAPPATISSFCSTLQQYATITNVTVSNATFSLCIDYPRWSQKGRRDDPQAQDKRFNGTHRFDLTPNSSAPGGVNCVVTEFGIPDPRSMPFSFIAIDADAAFMATSPGPVDGFPHVAICTCEGLVVYTA